MNKALFLENVFLRTGDRQIFSELYLEANRGEILTICGTSNSHFHFLPALLSRTLPSPFSLEGTVQVDGAEIQQLGEEEMRFARMMNLAVLPEIHSVHLRGLTVQKYITLPFKESVKKSVHEIMADARRIMQLLGISNPDRVLHRRLASLTAQDKRAVLYAAALSTDPAVAIVFTDTPDLSPTESDLLFSLLIKVCKIKNIALLMLTRDIGFARKYGERVYLAKKDRIFPLEGAAHPYLHFLEAAASMQTRTPAPCGEAIHLSAANAMPVRGMKSLDFVLHEGEILAFPCKNPLPVFTGRRKPVSGTLFADGRPLKKNMAFRKKIMPVHLGMSFPPVSSVDALASVYAVRPSQRLSTETLYTTLGLPADFGKQTCSQKSAFDTLRLGLVCAAIAEARVILLTDLERLTARADQYEILTLLEKVCAHTGAGALVFSNNTSVLHAVGTEFFKASSLAERPMPEVAEECASPSLAGKE